MDCIHSGHISPPSPRTPSASQSYSIIETAKANGLNPFSCWNCSASFGNNPSAYIYK